jgi:hypothetical protein
MPYIKKIDRKKFEDVLNSYKNLPEHITVGELNYLITSLLNITVHDTIQMSPDGRLDYKTLNAIIGVLECVKLEFYRRVVVPFELAKEEINGDVYLNSDKIKKEISDSIKNPTKN